MVGPNHYGIGSWVAAMKDGTWETPLGDVQVDSQMAEEIGRNQPLLTLTIMHTVETIVWRFSSPLLAIHQARFQDCAKLYWSLRRET